METTNLEFRPSMIDESPKGYEPTNQQLLQQHEIRIQFLSRGCVVHVGCKSIAFESLGEALKQLNYYIYNTCESQKEWNIVFDKQ